MGKLQQGINDLYTWCLANGEFGQQLISEWTGLDEANQPVSMNSVARASIKRVKWRCTKGHEWIATVNQRTALKSGCPYCSGLKASDQNSLNPWCLANGEFGQRLLKEWTGFDENNQPVSMNSISYGSRKKVKWKCTKGHKWTATIVYRTSRKSGCPYCSPAGTSFPEQYIYHVLKQLYPKAESRCKVLKSVKNPQGIEYDIGIPDIPLCIEYSPTYWHEGKEEYDEYKKRVCLEHNVRLIQIVEDSYNELEPTMTNNYICFHMERARRTEILQQILSHILQTLGHSIKEIDLEKAEKDTIKALEQSY